MSGRVRASSSTSSTSSSPMHIVLNHQWTIASLLTLFTAFIFTLNMLYSNHKQSNNPFPLTSTSSFSSSAILPSTSAEISQSLFSQSGGFPIASLSSSIRRRTQSTKSISYTKYHREDPRVQFLLQEYQNEILFSAKGNVIQVNENYSINSNQNNNNNNINKFYKIAQEKSLMSKSKALFFLEEMAVCQSSSLLHLFDVAQNDRVAVQRLYPDFHTKHLSKNNNKKTLFSLSFTTPPEEITPLSSSSSTNKAEVLIVFTTCNQLSMTILSLQYLRNTDKVADILVVDDHSTDGTVEYLRKKGFFVVTKPIATGLTDSWNIGYRLAVALGYKNVIFTNNDVLLTAGAVHLMYYGLRSHSLVVPLTTDKGSGHHKLQSIMNAHRLPRSMMNLVDDYRNAEFIQETLLRKYVYVSKDKRRCPAQQSINEKNQPKFNGFCFAVNIEKIAPAAYETGIHLFDPKDKIVGQEDSLTQRMEKAKLVPILLHCSFVFHFKSKTVSAANFTQFQEALSKHHARVIDSVSYPTVLIEYSNPKTKEKVKFAFDIRENLQWYHHNEHHTLDESSTKDDNDDTSFIESLMRRGSKDMSAYRDKLAHSTNNHNNNHYRNKSTLLYTPEERSILDIWQHPDFQCKATCDDILFPAMHNTKSNDNDDNNHVHNRNQNAPMKDEVTVFSSLLESSNTWEKTHFYAHYPEWSFDIREAPVCVYPVQWFDHCNQLLNVEKNMHQTMNVNNNQITHNNNNNNNLNIFEPELYAVSKPSVIVIAIAMSDPVATPSAGDIFVAYELGQALQQMYAHVKLRYLRKGFSWYNPALLYDVDILISLLDNYDLTKLMGYYLDSSVPNYFETTSFTCPKSNINYNTNLNNNNNNNVYQLKPTLITIAWTRNWFHRWVSKPYFGNYDLILTSSHLTQFFYQEVSDTLGFASSCANGCPMRTSEQGFTPPVLPTKYRPLTSKETANNNNTNNYKRKLNNNHSNNNDIDKRTYNDHFSRDTSRKNRKLAADTNNTNSNNINNNMNMNNDAIWQLFTPRLTVPAYVFPLATSLKYIRTISASDATSSTTSSSGKDTSSTPSQLADLLSVPSNASLTAKTLFQNVDYIFTGSFFQSYRRIMAFDPLLVEPFVGKIVGNNWLKANVSVTWKKHSLGSLPYEVVRESYKYVKIVIDDANHVTYPWGSTNSRVFDAVACGALIVSNTETGLLEVFGEAFEKYVTTGSTSSSASESESSTSIVGDLSPYILRNMVPNTDNNNNDIEKNKHPVLQRYPNVKRPLPIYDSAEELAFLLTYYLTYPEERRLLVSFMQEIVLEKHTYWKRAETLGHILYKQFRLQLPLRKTLQKQNTDNSNTNNMNHNVEMNVKFDRDLQRTLMASDNDPIHSDNHGASAIKISSTKKDNNSLNMHIEQEKRKADDQVAMALHLLDTPEEVLENNETVSLDKIDFKTLTGTNTGFGGDVEITNEDANMKIRDPHKAKKERRKLSGFPSRGNGLCIGVRTTAAHKEWLPVFVRSLIIQHSKSQYKKHFPLQLFLIDTEAKSDFAPVLIDLANKHNDRFKFPYVQILFGQYTQDKGVQNSVFGYDDTDKLLDFMLSIRKCGGAASVSHYNSEVHVYSNSSGIYNSNGRKVPLAVSVLDGDPSHIISPHGVRYYNPHTNNHLHAANTANNNNYVDNTLSTCEWIMFSNGDNMYNSAWFDTVAPLALSEQYDMIGWDFVTHHPRNGTANTPITVAFERKFMDLGSVMIRSELYGKSNTRFLSESVFTQDIFARDILTVLSLLQHTSLTRTKLIHQCLLLHQ